MITDNTFSRDTNSTHEERLSLMQSNFSTHASALSALKPDSIAWAATCYTVFNQKQVAALHLAGLAKGSTTAARNAFKILRKEFFAVQNYAKAEFGIVEDMYEDFVFNLPYPVNQGDQIDIIDAVLLQNTELVAASSPYVLPDLIVDLLTTARADAFTALGAKTEKYRVANKASNIFKAQKKVNITFLNKIYALAVIAWDDDHINLNDLGFARASQMGQGGGGSVPAAPSGLHFTDESTLAWTAVANATSYGVGLSYDGGSHWENDFTTDTNSTTVPVAEVGKLYYRVRSRNANGYGEYSGTFEKLFGLSAVDNFAFNDNEFTWNPVEFANGYDIQYSAVGEENWVLIFNGNATDFSHTPASGSWTYRIRASYGSIKSEWVEISIEQV